MSLHSRCSHFRSAHSTSCKTRLTDHECSPRQEQELLESNGKFVWRLQRAGAKSSGIIPHLSDLENKVLKPLSPFHPVLIRHKSKPAMNKGNSPSRANKVFSFWETGRKKGEGEGEGEGRDGWQALAGGHRTEFFVSASNIPVVSGSAFRRRHCRPSVRLEDEFQQEASAFGRRGK